MDTDYPALEIHRVSNGYIIKPTRGFVDQGVYPNGDFAVFNDWDDAAKYIEARLRPLSVPSTGA